MRTSAWSPSRNAPGVVEVLDHLAGDHHVGRRETERAHRVGVAAVDDVAVVAVLPCPGNALLVDVEADELARDDREVARATTRPPRSLQRLTAGVDEPHVHDALARRTGRLR